MTVLAIALMLAGLFFLLVATIGFVRLPDVFCRLHITGVMDTLGVPLMLLGVAVYVGAELTSAKLILGVVFLFGTSPLVGHLLARSALESGHAPAPGTRGTPPHRPPMPRTVMEGPDPEQAQGAREREA